ncbi:MAG TPA: ATP-binding protein [Solirubrobacteraceae bacterium]|jgi:signal transduction histidine kinase
MQPLQTATGQGQGHAATLPRELERIEHAFRELGLPGDARAREQAHHAALDTLGKRDVAAADSQATTLLFARTLFADALPTLIGSPGLTARLIDRLADELGDTRAQIAQELLGAAELAGAPGRFVAEVLLALVEGSDRRLTRLGFDLHDGPLQELLLLGEDLRMFRGQLTSVLAEGEKERLLRGRLDDLDARLVELERALRRISTAVHASFLTDRPFAEAVHELTEAFAARTGIAPAVSLEGELSSISPSQRIALLSVVGEALNNVREHGATADAVEVTIGLGVDGVRARVHDNGCGFEVEAALLDAARRGHIGLAGIHERVRLLGGDCIVESRPGGPTAVSLRLPRWEPLSDAPTVGE